VVDSIKWNSQAAISAADKPPATSAHGTHTYVPLLMPNSWWWGNNTYNDTWNTVFVNGTTNAALALQVVACAAEDCTGAPPTAPGNGTWLRWSELTTWPNGAKPTAGACLCMHWLAWLQPGY
jgi:hypothetical protein